MKQYLLSIYHPDGPPPAPEVLGTITRDVATVREAMKTANVWVFAGGLHPSSSATVVRPGSGEPLLTDGPFVEGKEHVGGIVVIKAADLDAALEWGARLARAVTVPVEVRPFREEH